MPLVALDRRELVALRRCARDTAEIGERRLGVVTEAAEVVEEVPDGVRRRDEVGVEDHHVLGLRVHPLQGFLERTALEALAGRAVEDPHARVLTPLVEYREGLRVGRVVGDDDLVVVVVERRAGAEQPVDDVPLVVHGEVHRDERLLVAREAMLADPIRSRVDDRADLVEPLTAQRAVLLMRGGVLFGGLLLRADAGQDPVPA